MSNASVKANSRGRYEYYRAIFDHMTVLVRHDGYRIAFQAESWPARAAADMPIQAGLDEWVHMMEYKQCDFGNVADAVMKTMLSALCPADVTTIEERFFDE